MDPMGIAIVSTQQKTTTPLGPLFSNSFNNGVATHLFLVSAFDGNCQGFQPLKRQSRLSTVEMLLG